MDKSVREVRSGRDNSDSPSPLESPRPRMDKPLREVRFERGNSGSPERERDSREVGKEEHGEVKDNEQEERNLGQSSIHKFWGKLGAYH